MKKKYLQQQIHFETQGTFSNQCGVHALNNILGKQVFTCEKLNQFCQNISSSIINPHKHIFGGDFDVNILMIALQSQGYECRWIDNRQKFQNATRQNISKDQLYGFLINKQSQNSSFLKLMKNAFGFSGRHWIAIKKIQKEYYLLDSKRQKPQNLNNILSFLAVEAEMGSHIIEVYKKIQDNSKQAEKQLNLIV